MNIFLLAALTLYAAVTFLIILVDMSGDVDVDFPRVIVFWPLMVVKWFIKTLYEELTRW